jgi:hypothetical protein
MNGFDYNLLQIGQDLQDAQDIFCILPFQMKGRISIRFQRKKKQSTPTDRNHTHILPSLKKLIFTI